MVAILLCYMAGCAKTIELKTFPTTKRAVGELKSGSADAVVGDYPVVAFEARESAGALEVTGYQFDKETIGIGVSKKAVELKAVITHALRRIIENKSYSAILASWALVAAPIDPPPAPATVPEVSTVSQLQDGELKVGMELGYPPMEFFDELNKEAGVDVELAQALGMELGVNVVFVDMPFDALINAVESRKVDIILSTMAVTEERSELIDFIPYIELGSGILIPKGNPNTIRSLKDLCGHTVAVQGGTSQSNAVNAVSCK